MYEKGNYWGLFGSVNDSCLGILCDEHLHNEWSCGDLHDLLLWWKLHDKLFLNIMFGNGLPLAGEKAIHHRPAMFPQ